MHLEVVVAPVDNQARNEYSNKKRYYQCIQSHTNSKANQSNDNKEQDVKWVTASTPSHLPTQASKSEYARYCKHQYEWEQN